MRNMLPIEQPLLDEDYLFSLQREKARRLSRLAHWRQAEILSDPLGRLSLQLGQSIVADLEKERRAA